MRMVKYYMNKMSYDKNPMIISKALKETHGQFYLSCWNDKDLSPQM